MVRGSESGMFRTALSLALLVALAPGCQHREPEHPEAQCTTSQECMALRTRLVNKFYKCSESHSRCQEYNEKAQAAADRAEELRKQEEEQQTKARKGEDERGRALQAELETRVKQRCGASASACEQAVAELKTECEECRKSGKHQFDCEACLAESGTNKLVAESRAREQREEEKAKRAQAEQRKDEETAKLEARKAEARKLALDKRYGVAALSILLCDAQESLATQRKDLARERAISQKGGVIDLSAQRSLAEGMQASEEQIQTIRRQLTKGYSAQPV